MKVKDFEKAIGEVQAAAKDFSLPGVHTVEYTWGIDASIKCGHIKKNILQHLKPDDDAPPEQVDIVKTIVEKGLTALAHHDGPKAHLSSARSKLH